MAPKKKYYRKANSSHTNTGILNLINQNNQKFIDLTMEAVDTFLMEYDLTQVKFNAVSVNTSMLKKELYKLLVVRSRDGNYSKSIVNMAYKYVTDMSFKDYVGAYILHTEEKAVKFKEEKPQLFAQQLRDGTLRLLRRYEVMAKDRYDLLIERNKTYGDLYKEIYSQRRKIDSLISDSIPESIPGLYPLARQMTRHFIMHVGPTNSGKTYNALEALKKANTGIYLAPLRLLAYEVYDRINEAGVPCNMITGEEEIIVKGAQHTSATIETLDVLATYDEAVIDEGQLIGERQRGGAWTRAILGLCAKTIHICSDESCVNIICKIIEECGDTYEIIHHERAVPLKFDEREFSFPGSVEEKDALIVFSKRAVIAVAAELQNAGIKTSIIYGALPYDVRMNEVRRFIEGETSVVVATDAIGMGLNLPIKRMVFLEMNKFDGEVKRILNATEIKQIAGRAGRRGIFETGYYTSEYQSKYVKDAVEGPLPSVQKARLSIPESIINLKFPLSDIMRRWLRLQNDEIYEKADLEEDIAICRELEGIVDDKDTLYSLVTIAFDKGKTQLVALLKEFAGVLVSEDYDNKEKELNRIIDSAIVMSDDILDEMSMEELETLYSRYDLMYGFLRKFAFRDRLYDIVEAKRECSSRIMDMLKEQSLETKKCVDCGQELSWNYPFARCELCHKRHKILSGKRYY